MMDLFLKTAKMMRLELDRERGTESEGKKKKEGKKAGEKQESGER